MEKLNTINDLFRLKGHQFLNRHPHLKKSAESIVTAIGACRTAALGGRVEQCNTCGHKVIRYNSCRNRHCPQCQALKKEKWVLEKSSELFPFPYFHVVFTLPDELASLVYHNKRRLYKLLFASVKESLLSMTREEKYFGARIGFFAILHTWGQRLNLHPHLHCVVPGGGFSEKKQKWIQCGSGWIVPNRALSKRFRSIYLQALKKIYHQGELYLKGSEYEAPEDFQGLIDALFQKDWVVYIKETFRHTQRVIQYLARYTHRIAISNHRIKKIDAETIEFTFKDYRTGQRKLLTLSHQQFMGRYLLHILPKGFVRIRYYGLYAHCKKRRCLEEVYAAWGLPVPERRETSEASWQEIFQHVLGRQPDCCPNCKKGKLLVVEDLAKRPRSPPG